MKQLTCEMCGSTQMKKEDGVFVCEACGMKYSADEAKKLLVEVDSTPMIENYLEVARNARKSGNNQEAELYVNKILEIDPNHAEAWLLKGCTSGWQSTLGNIRFLECVNCWQKALKYADDSQIENLCKIIAINTTGLAEAIISLIMKNYARYPDKDEVKKVRMIIATIKDFYSDVCKLNSNIELNEQETWNTITETIRENYMSAAQVISQQYGPNDSDRNQFAYATFKERMMALYDMCIIAIENCSKFHTLEACFRDLMRGRKTSFDVLIEAYLYEFNSSLGRYVKALGLTDQEKNELSYKASSIRTLESKKVLEIAKYYNYTTPDAWLIMYQSAIKSENYGIAKYALDIHLSELSKEEQETSSLKLLKAIVLISKVDSFAMKDYNRKKALELVKEAIQLRAEGKIGGETERALVLTAINSSQEVDDDNSLLLIAAGKFDYECVNFLVEEGADVNKKSRAYYVTALWYVASDRIATENHENARKIAKLLLDKGASINVKNKGGVALFNSKTDYEIAKMIFEKYPDAQRGDAPASSSSSSGGCYVATAVYGSYDCPQVWTLRRYRDNTLASTWYGRAFIHTYYAISPTLVKWFGHTEWFKKMWQGKLDKMVEKLQSEGVESTPYEDKNW